MIIVQKMIAFDGRGQYPIVEGVLKKSNEAKLGLQDVCVGGAQLSVRETDRKWGTKEKLFVRVFSTLP
jgi:hypothetical protein